MRQVGGVLPEDFKGCLPSQGYVYDRDTKEGVAHCLQQKMNETARELDFTRDLVSVREEFEQMIAEAGGVSGLKDIFTQQHNDLMDWISRKRTFYVTDLEKLAEKQNEAQQKLNEVNDEVKTVEREQKLFEELDLLIPEPLAGSPKALTRLPRD